MYKNTRSYGFRGRRNRPGPGFRANLSGKYINPARFINKPVEMSVANEYIPKFSFSDFNLNESLLQNIIKKGYKNPTPIQDQAISPIMNGRDVIGIANTGTGKTAAFLVPLINTMHADRQMKTLIVAPTRELALQIRDEFLSFTEGSNLSPVLIIGGTNIQRQVRRLRRDYNIVIATPGRLLDLVKRNSINLSRFTKIVLDEVDRMLDIGFIHDVKRIISYLPKNRQSLFFSATVGNREEEIIKSLHNKYSAHKATQEIYIYLKNFGARIPNELKLESETLAENPKNFISLVKILVQGELIQNNAIKEEHIGNNYKSLSFFKKLFLGWLLRWAGNSIYRREDARFRRTLVFGHVREIFIEIGKKLGKEGFIKNTRDIFYLSIEEIFKIIDGKELNFDPLGIVEQRKLKLEKWKNIEMLRRFETTKSIPEIENDLLNQPVFSQKEDSYQLKGTVASRPNNTQMFSGTTLTLKDFDPLANFEGKILVTCQTDPGWTVVFPLLKGIVVERGGMLSHAAIVARELNIPCIVGVQQATDFLSTDMRIVLNLQNGSIQRL